jgi:hypothetical protein
MNLPSVRHLLLPLALAGALTVHAEEKQEPSDPAPQKHERRVKVIVDHDGPGPMEKVTFLGVETMPADAALADQLGLTRGTGLVVNRVVKDSPATAVLKEHDVLTRFGDQILIDQHQLSVLVRSHKADDEVALTVIRGGKESTLKVKLASHEVPAMADLGGFGHGEAFRFFHNGEMPGLEGLRELPGMAREDVDNVVRMLGRDHFNLMVHPQVRIMERKGGGGNSTILDLNQGNIVFSDEEGSMEINANDGKRELTLKNPKGEVTFKGPLTSEEDHRKLPPEVATRLKKIQQIEVGEQAGEDFEQEGVTVRREHKISLPHPLRPERDSPPEHHSF